MSLDQMLVYMVLIGLLIIVVICGAAVAYTQFKFRNDPKFLPWGGIYEQRK